MKTMPDHLRQAYLCHPLLDDGIDGGDPGLVAVPHVEEDGQHELDGGLGVEGAHQAGSDRLLLQVVVNSSNLVERRVSRRHQPKSKNLVRSPRRTPWA